jgi:hypothetical protein
MASGESSLVEVIGRDHELGPVRELWQNSRYAGKRKAWAKFDERLPNGVARPIMAGKSGDRKSVASS